MTIESNGGPNYGILTQRFLSGGQWDRSLATAQEWLSKDSENIRAHRAAAQSLLNLERPEEAGKHIEKVLAGNPNDGFAHRLMAMVHFKAGRFRLADESIRKAISLNPMDAYHWHQLAYMSYRQGDLATARKCVARARELNPRDADILNLAILCEANGPETADKKIRQFEDALALDPENTMIYNNIGVQYLNKQNDYAKAEEYFRRALFFDPASKTFRKNLFVTLKHRDLIYRILCTPKDWLVDAAGFFNRMRKRNLFLYILMIPLWLLAFRFVFAGLVLWFALVWPLTKVYEFLTVGDIRARAGEVGVRRGGFLGYRKWPLKLRLSIFALFLVSFWGAIAFVCFRNNLPADGKFGQAVLGMLLIVGALVAFGLYLRRIIKRGIAARAARKRAGQMESVFNAGRNEEA
jgi:Flp pilus assembly protein TadD